MLKSTLTATCTQDDTPNVVLIVNRIFKVSSGNIFIVAGASINSLRPPSRPGWDTSSGGKHRSLRYRLGLDHSLLRTGSSSRRGGSARLALYVHVRRYAAPRIERPLRWSRTRCAGLYQVNFIVTAGTPAGNQALIITVNGATSPPNAFLSMQ
jgi:hypothetical protein